MIKAYRKKPKRGSEDEIRVAKYEPSDPGSLAAIRELGEDAASGFCMAEVNMPEAPGPEWLTGEAAGRVLLVRWMDIPDDHAAREEFRTIRPGRYLATSPGWVDLYVTDDADLRQWYDEVPAHLEER